MYYGKINENDIANGLGVRVTLFVSELATELIDVKFLNIIDDSM